MKMKSVREFFAKLGEWRDTSGAASGSAAPASWRLYGPVAALGLAMFAIALSGYPNLLDNERRIGAYVLDAVLHGHWIMQYDVTGAVASKPPLLTWIAALSTAAFGEINRFSIYLPSALATLGVALLLVGAGKKHFGWRAGFLAGSGRRVEEQDLLAQLDRGVAKDQVDAQNDLINSRNQRTQAVIAHTLARLQFWNNLGILYIKENGQWDEVPVGIK